MEPVQILKTPFLTDEEKRALVTYRGVSSDCFLSPLALLTTHPPAGEVKKAGWLQTRAPAISSVEMSVFVLNVIIYLIISLCAASGARRYVAQCGSAVLLGAWVIEGVLCRLGTLRDDSEHVERKGAPLNAFVTFCTRFAAFSRKTACGAALAVLCGDTIVPTLMIATATNFDNLGGIVAIRMAACGEGRESGAGLLRTCRRALILLYGNVANDMGGFLLFCTLGVSSVLPTEKMTVSLIVCSIFLCSTIVTSITILSYRYKGLAFARMAVQALSPQVILALQYGLAAYLIEKRFAGSPGSLATPFMFLRLAYFSAQASLLARRELKQVTFLEPWRWRSFPDLLWFGFAIPLFCFLGVHPTIVTGLAATHMTTLTLTFCVKCVAEVADHVRVSIWHYDDSMGRFER